MGPIYYYEFQQFSKKLLLTFTGGKQGVPGNVPNRFLQGFDGCIRKVKIFRRKLDLFRQGGNSNLQQCSTN